MKRLICAAVMVCCSVFAHATSITAPVAYVLDTETNTVLFQKNDSEVRPIASITKLMTAYVTVEANLPLDEQLTITQDDVEATRLRGGPTGGTLPLGTTLTRGELLHLALMNSQNRAAAALGRTYPGGMTAFVEMMNTTAATLGMQNTHYVDPTGLYDANRSTANDLAVLVQAAAKHDIIRELSTSTKFELGPRRVFGTTDRLVYGGKWGIMLQKTGFITNAGHCVVMLADTGSHKVVIVLLDEANNQTRARDAIMLMYMVEHNELPSMSELYTLDPQPVIKRVIRRITKHKHRK